MLLYKKLILNQFGLTAQSPVPIIMAAKKKTVVILLVMIPIVRT